MIAPPGGLADRRGAIEHLLRELGVVPSTGQVLRMAGFDGFEFRIMLPFDVEDVKIPELDMIRSPRAVVDAVAAARDRLFARVLGHMATHDIEIGALLRRKEEAARKRDDLIAIIEGMSAPSAPSEVKP